MIAGKRCTTPHAHTGVWLVEDDFGSRWRIWIAQHGAEDYVGGVACVHDMSGNAWEWVNGCTEDKPEPRDDICLFRGGGCRNTLDEAQCSTGSFFRRSAALKDIGFRRCKSL